VLVRDAQRLMQRHFQALNPGPEDGKFGDRTERALKAFQRLAGIPETGLPDQLTRDRLQLGDEDPIQVNIAQTLQVTCGVDLVVGFVDRVRVDHANEWGRALWNALKTGSTIREAAEQAGAAVRGQVVHNVYAAPEAGDNFKLYPARYGRSPF
jgi:peptidoglycan hydrolase-like protein with peptidoglycan-binding domain